MTEKELTAKEKKRLKMVALGDTAQEIAEREYRSVHTIRESLDVVKNKVGGKNTANTIYIATKDGLIE